MDTQLLKQYQKLVDSPGIPRANLPLKTATRTKSDDDMLCSNVTPKTKIKVPSLPETHNLKLVSAEPKSKSKYTSDNMKSPKKSASITKSFKKTFEKSKQHVMNSPRRSRKHDIDCEIRRIEDDDSSFLDEPSDFILSPKSPNRSQTINVKRRRRKRKESLGTGENTPQVKQRRTRSLSLSKKPLSPFDESNEDNSESTFEGAYSEADINPITHNHNDEESTLFA